MKLRSPAGLAAGLVSAALLAAPAAAAGPAPVTVRAEGLSGTVVPRTAVTTTNAVVNNDGQSGHDCTGTSGAGALQQATAGDWTGTWYDGLGYQVRRIRGEQDDPSSTFWSFWLNYRPSAVGLCDAELQPGDEVLLFLDCFAVCSKRMPLRLSRVPATVTSGSSAAVRVETFGDDGTAVPAAGATVDVGGRRFTTGSDGIAHVTFDGSGRVGLRATKSGHVPSATEVVTVGAVSATPVAPDTTAPTGRILGIRDGQRFRRRRAPRELRGTVTADPSGLWGVKIRLTRRHRGKCWYFSGSKERFLKRTCGKKYAFKVGDRAEWSYLLPARLRRGRYVLDVYGIDNAFNRGAIVRGTSRVRFRVR